MSAQKQMTPEQASNAGLVELLIDDHHGMYVPQVFARSYVVKEGSLDGDMTICAGGPDREYYWEAWANILDGGTIEGLSGHAWYLMQDGDLWAIRDDANVTWDES